MSVRILVVDDQPAIANTLGKVLRLLGHVCRVAYGGSQALEVAAEFEPELVISDLAMPEMDGLMLAGRLRQLTIAPPPFLVAHSANEDADQQQQAKEAGFERIFTKPMSARGDEFQEIVAIVKQRRRFGPT